MNRGVCPKINAAPAIIDRTAKLRHRALIGDVHGGEGGLATTGLDLVIKIFECTCCARDSNHVVSLCQRFCQCKSKAARCASDQCYFAHVGASGGNNLGKGRGLRDYSAAFSSNPLVI